ncbi:MAG: TetR/AcrR family transcriptional regulator [Herbiconiux sp.]|uniref:TetR/AcrR family transcriptional regulator n=1 Tax=Herbiconiux sp. TaxID=1871186 RepID=UPI0011FFA6DE|nr:TetR/AcrR family transcriptional regulator [Herbiconiux sp.]TAJ46457.1 MAG: TetR/AcrR family transcriptional regulator [Herbiconiux sp.]
MTLDTAAGQTQVPSARPSEARERLLRVASELFYREGIHRTGMDRILSDAGVTRATMYRHFVGKESLVAAYLRREDDAIRTAFTAAMTPDSSPSDLVDHLLEAIADDIALNHTRGCPFINAAVEYPDATGEVRRIVAEHRAWFRDAVHSALEASGAADPAEDTEALVLLRDAALIGGYLDGATATRATFLRTARRALEH